MNSRQLLAVIAFASLLCACGSRTIAVQETPCDGAVGSAILAQGPLVDTGNATDLAIQGAGFFIVANDAGTAYTRWGEFTIAPDGRVVNSLGMVLQGYSIDASGAQSTDLSDLVIDSRPQPASATGQIWVSANFGAATAVSQALFDPSNAVATSDFHEQLTIYDSFGQAYAPTLYFKRTSAGTWDWHALVFVAAQGVTSEIGRGSLVFSDAGALVSARQDTTAQFYPNGTAASPQQLVFDFGLPGEVGDGGTAAAPTGFVASTQTMTESSVSLCDADGNPAGELESLNIFDGQNNLPIDLGVLLLNYSNGQFSQYANVAVAIFENPAALRVTTALERLVLLSPTDTSGAAMPGVSAVGGRGVVFGGALEDQGLTAPTCGAQP